jgi:penicillin amidase
MHQMRVAHMLANVPVLGKRWIFEQYPVSGGNETLFKTNASIGAEKGTTFYGACSRHISDLSDMDENYFVLLGGQDGWMTSPQTLDQVSLWKSGKYIRFPLRLTTIQKEFKKVVTLSPKD